MFAFLTRLATRRPGLVAAAIGLLTVVALVGSSGLANNLSAGGFADSDAEAIKARTLIEDASGATSSASVVALVRPGAAVTSDSGRAAIAAVAKTLTADPGVARVAGPFDGPGGAAQISADGESAYLVVAFKAQSEDARIDTAKRIEDALGDDANVLLGGESVVANQVTTIVGEDLARAELLVFPILAVLSLLIFRGLIASVLPVAMGAVAIFISFLAIAIANSITTMSVFALNLVISLSLGLAIDYSLLVVSRYREELAKRGPGVDAIRATLATAGKSVVFSAVTVAAALAGLMVFPQNFLFSMGLGGVFAALIAGAVAVILLPAVLMLLGERINSLAPKAWKRRTAEADLTPSSGAWYRLSRFVMKRPGVIAVVAGAVMLALTAPVLSIAFTTVDASVLPTSASSRQVGDALERDFPAGRTNPLVVAVQTGRDDRGAAAVTQDLATYSKALGALPGATAASPPVPVGNGVYRIDLIPRDDALSDNTQDLLTAARATPAAYPTLVGGVTAEFVDQRTSLGAHLPWAIAFISITTIVALFLMTGSVFLPVKAVVMNLLTLGATMGILKLIFQDGRLEGLLDFTSQGALDLTQPILIGAIAFGLSTDYSVFLLSRIKELHDQGVDNKEAVALGVQRTGRIVSSAAILFAVAVGAFATSQIVLLKEIGIGTALAVLIDATIVRALLVPALMGLMGRWNWWAPAPLRRFHDRFGLQEG